MSSSQTVPPLHRWLRWSGAAVALVMIIAVMASIWPTGPDYYFTFDRTAHKWLDGETRLYDDHPTTEVPGNPDIGFFNAPWLLIILVPLALLPLNWGQAILTTGSLIGILGSIRILKSTGSVPIYVLVLAVANLHTFDVLIRGQIDVIPLVGVVLGWWALQARRPLWLSAAFALMAIKPISALLPAVIFLLCIRKWRVKDILLAISLPAALCLISGIFFGFDWPLRYLNYVAANLPSNDYLSTSLWRGVAELGLPTFPLFIVGGAAVLAILFIAWKVGLNQWILAVTLATNLLFSTYIHGNHYVLLIPVLVVLARKDWRLVLLAYLATLTPLLRLTSGFQAARIDVIYPLVAFILLWALKLWETRSSPQKWWRALLDQLRAESTDERAQLREAVSPKPASARTSSAA